MFLSFVVSWFYPCSFCLWFGDAGYPRQFPDQMVVESFLNWVSNGQSTKWKPMKRKLSLKFHCCLVSSIFVYLEWSWTVSKLQGLYVQSTQTYLLKQERNREKGRSWLFWVSPESGSIVVIKLGWDGNGLWEPKEPRRPSLRVPALLNTLQVPATTYNIMLVELYFHLSN